MKATALLENQHRTVEKTLEKLESVKGDPEPLLMKLANDLAAHMAIEQNIFYPEVRRLKADLVAESFEEHAVAEFELKRLLKTEPHSEEFQARVATLQDLILHHVEEEEEELFPAVEEALGDAKLSALGVRMKKAFEEALEKGYEALLPKGASKTSSDESLKGRKGSPPRADRIPMARKDEV